MNKLISALTLSLLCAGCKGSKTAEEVAKAPDITVIDGCEYITDQNRSSSYDSYSFAITHKGNCSNPIHVYNTPNAH